MANDKEIICEALIYIVTAGRHLSVAYNHIMLMDSGIAKFEKAHARLDKAIKAMEKSDAKE